MSNTQMNDPSLEQVATSAVTYLGDDQAPLPLKILSFLLFAFGILAFVGSLFLWGEGFILRPPDGINIALPIADMVINAPASIVAAVGLWRMRRYGYLGGYFVAGFYLYASTFILWDAFAERPFGFWAIVIPQVVAVLVALALLIYLPRLRGYFR